MPLVRLRVMVVGSLLREHGLDAAFVLLLGADGDADVFREAVAVHGAEDDALGEAFVEAG